MSVVRLILVGLLAWSAPALAGRVPGSSSATEERPTMAVPGIGVTVRSTGTAASLAARETTGPDTFALYGGPDRPSEGKFQLVDGITPDWGDGTGLPGGPYGGGPASWWPVDLTDQPGAHWHQDTFNAENLNGHGAGNHALWSGEPAGVPASFGWGDPPGYGSYWDDRVIYESAPVADPAQGQVVSLDFFFNVDVFDVGWDFFIVEYETAGVWNEVYRISDSNLENGVAPAPGLQYSTLQPDPIVYAGNDYGGLGQDQIRIRLRTISDGGWDDQDGLGPSVAGLVQVDDVTLTTSQGTFTEDFEGAGPYLFVPERAPFAGDFAELYPGFDDIDPCRDNSTPTVGFIDFGQAVRNGPAPSGPSTTGGSVSPAVNYGIPGHYVVNYTGGVSFGEKALDNEIWSPEILWDLPGTDDDDPEIAGVFMRFSVWDHLPLGNGIFYTWRVRSTYAAPVYYPWRKPQDVYLFYSRGRDPSWQTVQFDVSAVIRTTSPERLQFALGVVDYAELLGIAGGDATPSPVFDDFACYKYRLPGPVLEAQVVDLAQDGFPVNGSIDAGSPAARDALDIPFSMARDINWGHLTNVPGDSVAFTADPRIPGTTLDDLRMVWALKTNALFEDALRAAPARAKDENVVAGGAGSVWSGEVVAAECTNRYGFWVQDRFFVDLPDQDFMYPGDVLHYYIRATDDDGRVTTLPADVSGFGVFGDGATYDRTFTVRALPSLMDPTGAQPAILVINDFGRRGGEADWVSAMADLEFVEGLDFDSYTVQGPTSMVSNGIGSAHAHGATVDQLAAYHDLLYFAGDLAAGLLSDGSNTGNNDKGDDIGVLQQWHALAGGRNAAYFGDNIGSALAQEPAGQLFAAQTLGIQVLGPVVKDYLGGQLAPLAVPVPADPQDFATDFVVYGGCPSIRHLDAIRAGGGAAPAHWWADAYGVPMTGITDPVASVLYPTVTGVRLTFPFSFSAVQDDGEPYVIPARSWLMAEILFDAFGHVRPSCVVGGTWPVCTDAPERVAPAELTVRPNPFNPATTVEFTAAIGTKGSVRVYNLRGQVVRTLHSGEFQTQTFSWNGTDDRGASVASGVYLVQAEDGRVRQVRKVALVK